MKLSEYEQRATALFERCAFNYAAWLAGVELLNKEFDAARAPVADAAQFLFMYHGFTANWLKAKSAAEIQIYAKANGEAAYKMGAPLDTKDLLALGWIVSPWRFAIMVPVEYPQRLETADAALYLFLNFATNESWLRRSTAATIRVDAQDCREAMEARKVKVKVTVKRLGDETSGDYIHLKFFKGQRLVGETMIEGKTTSPYDRVLTLSGDFDCYRQECSNTAIFTVERVAK